MPLASTYKLLQSGEPGIVFIFLRFLTGTTGAVSTIRNQHGFKTPTRTSAGLYNLPLTERWPGFSLVDYNVTFIGATGLGITGRVTTEDYQAPAGGVPSVTIQFSDAATPSAADVPSGADIIVRLTMKNVSIK